MEFRETLLAAQRNQQQKSSAESSYYKARFDPPKKEQKSRDRLSANIQKFLAKKEEEEKQKKLDVQRKKDELLAMRDPKALRKIQKTLKVIKSANKSVIADAIDTEHTAVTREGPDQPDQDDYGYESQEAAALYEKMMQKYSKMPVEPKFPSSSSHINKDLNGTRERVKNALQHEEEPVPHKRRRRTENDKDREASPPLKYEPERKKDEKPEKPKFRKPAPPPMDFNQLLKLAEQKKSEPLDVASKKVVSESESVRPMTKKQRREYEEEMARRQRRQERLEAEKSGKKVMREERNLEKDKPEKRTEPSSFGRIPKLGEKNSNDRKSQATKTSEKDNYTSEREKVERIPREKDKVRSEREKIESEKLRQEKERFERLKAERDRIDREMEKFREREKLDKPKAKFEKTAEKKSEKIIDRSKTGAKEHEVKKSIDLKSQNTYRIDKICNEKKLNVPQKGDQRLTNGHVQGKAISKMGRDVVNRSDAKDKLVATKPKNAYSDGSQKTNGIRSDKKLPDARRPDDRRPMPHRPAAGTSKVPMNNSFDFDKHVNSLNKNGSRFTTGGVKRKPNPDDIRKKQKRRLDSDSEYDSEMDDFIDDGDENMDYSTHIKEIFGYDKAKYRDLDDDDDPSMESSFSRQQREEYISKKIGIMEDLEDMRMEAMEKSKKKKQRRISDD